MGVKGEGANPAPIKPMGSKRPRASTKRKLVMEVHRTPRFVILPQSS